jgi:hemerythrin-like domain-containing protein
MSEGTRRSFLIGSASVSSVLVLGCASTGAPKAEGAEREAGAEEVTPAEDLMREHGALNRVLLLYEESARRLEGAQPLPIEALSRSADIVRRFIEQYHEKLEEEFLFPRFEKAGKLVELVATLRRQHLAGRVLTETILQLSKTDSLGNDEDRQRLAQGLRSFTRMYRPHEAREDTVLFPALPGVFRHRELDELGEQFEDKEHELFGKEGFEGVVKQLEGLEQAFGLFDLNQFTPSSG